MKISGFLKDKLGDILIKIDSVEKEFKKKKLISDKEKKINKTKN